MLPPADRAAVKWQRVESAAEVPGSLPATWTDQTSVNKQMWNRNETEKSHNLDETW